MPAGVKRPGAVFLHGGGKSTKERFALLQESFSQAAVASIAIDFRGIGGSSGVFADGGIANRILDANAACDFFLGIENVDPHGLVVVGASMGAAVAIGLTEVRDDVKALILISPAAYSKRAYNLRLGRGFQAVVREENSWTESPSFGSLANFKGPVMVVYGENDVVIPQGVKTRYKNSLKGTDEYRVIIGGFHTLLDLEGGVLPRTFVDLRDGIVRFLQNTLEF